jgi:hypothetical protein
MLDGKDSIPDSSINFSANALKLRALSLGVKLTTPPSTATVISPYTFMAQA